MEARRTHQRHMAGVAVGMLLKPSKGVRDDIVRAGGKPKDHMKQNRDLLRNMQRSNRQKKEEEAKEPPAPFVLKQFANIGPKICTQRSRSGSSTSESSTGGQSLQENSRPTTASTTDTSRSRSASKNFITINAIKARESKSNATSGTATPTHESKLKMGQIPKYLVDRKLEWARKEEERIMALEQDKIPAGMSLLPNLERIRTLNGLDLRRKQLLDELSRFPMVVELERVRARKSKIEAELKDVEQGIDIFSRPKVFVPKGEYDKIVMDR